MAEIIQNEPVSDNALSGWDTFVEILKNYWWVLLIFCIIIALIVICFMIWKKKEENDRRRDSSVYATAMNLTEATAHNAKTEWIRCYYSLWNLLWLGIPFKWNEHSVKIIDLDRNNLGWYRGHTRTPDGDLVFQMYKSKIWLGLFEDKFLLYCPMKLRHPKMKVTKNKDGSNSFVEMRNEQGNIIFEYSELPSDLINFNDVRNGNEIRIGCNTITKQGSYYYFPNYVFLKDGTLRHVDLTDHIAANIAKNNYLTQLEHAYSDMSRAAGRAVELNPELRFKQKSPEKEKQIEEDTPDDR